MVETVDDVSRCAVCWNVVGEIIGNQRQRDAVIEPNPQVSVWTRRKIWIGRPVVQRSRRPVEQRRVIRALVVLWQRVETVFESVRAWELTEKRIEAPVFLVNHDDVPQPLHCVLA